MTLVVARRIGNEIFVLSDTQIVDPRSTKKSPLSINPKIINFQHAIVGVAGVIDPVYAEWGKFPCDIRAEDIEDQCKSLIKRYGEHIEFIVINRETNEIKRLSNYMTRESSSEWIGSQQALEKLQEYVSNERDAAGIQGAQENVLNIIKMESENQDFNEHYSLTIRAFRRLLGASLHDVGGFPVTYLHTTHYSGFGFYVAMHSGQPTENPPLEKWVPVEWNFDKPEVGSYSHSFCGSTSGFQITIPQIKRQVSWHSPFVAYSEPAESPFISGKQGAS